MCNSSLSISPDLEVRFFYLCCQPCCKVSGHSLHVCWFWHQSFRLLALIWDDFSVPCSRPVGWPVVMLLGDVGHCSPFCGGIIAGGKLAAMHLQTEPYHFTVVTYLQQHPPLPPAAVLNRSSYCVFETFPDVDKLVLAQSNILARSLYS